MAFIVNSPPPGVVVSTVPTTKELSSRSLNSMPANLYKRRSLDGRRFLPTLNGFALDLNTARNVLADKFATGLNASIDAAQSPNQGGGGSSSQILPISSDNPAWDADNSDHNAVTVTSPTRTLTVPANNTGDLLLTCTLGYTTQYKINAGTWITFTNNTICNVANGNTLTLQALNVTAGNEVIITIIDNTTGQTIGSGDLTNAFIPIDREHGGH